MKTIQTPLNQHSPIAMTKADWKLTNVEWRKDYSTIYLNGEPRFIVDLTTGKKYLNESKNIVRLKCLYPGLVMISAISAIAGVINIAYRSGKILSGYHFWTDKTSEKTYKFSAKINNNLYRFKARFDVLNFVNSLLYRKSELLSVRENADGTFKFKVRNEHNQVREIDAKAVDHFNIDSGMQDVKHQEITLLDFKKISTKYDLKSRIIELAKDVGRIVASPLVVIALTFSALYGLLKPYEARKLISSIALAVCGTTKVAACFAPEASFHILGGDINTQNAF
jgi:hypothetical protein